jgi:hypothetical protein
MDHVSWCSTVFLRSTNSKTHGVPPSQRQNNKSPSDHHGGRWREKREDGRSALGDHDICTSQKEITTTTVLSYSSSNHRQEKRRKLCVRSVKMDHARPLTGTSAQLEPLNRDDIARANDPKQRHGDGRPHLVRRGKIKEWLQTKTTTQSETIDRGDDGWDGRSPVNSRCWRERDFGKGQFQSCSPGFYRLGWI